MPHHFLKTLAASFLISLVRSEMMPAIGSPPDDVFEVFDVVFTGKEFAACLSFCFAIKRARDANLTNLTCCQFLKRSLLLSWPSALWRMPFSYFSWTPGVSSILASWA